MFFNDLLKEQNIDLEGVLVLRHTPIELDLRKILPWLAAERPNVFNAYQQTQGPSVEAEMLRAKYVASFIGLEKRKERAEHEAVFIGLYQVGGHHRLTYEDFWKIPEFQEMKKFGMRGLAEGDRSSCLWFDLLMTDFYKKWLGKLVVEWPRPPIKWSRFASRAKFPISAILEESRLIKAMPDWTDCIWSWNELGALPSTYRARLRDWRGIYYIFDQADGKGYVGAASGKDNILGRWEHYADSGHGGDVLLRERSPENFVFSILERVSPDMERNDVQELEASWKRRLHTRTPFGLNGN